MAEKLTYEKAIVRLEEIVEKLDDGSLSLDESIKLFEESTKLAMFCNDCLEKAKLKVSELSAAE
ncbi:MAG: exodeoxyribonuclease VII small subunit [Acutalibacteraceae bacterium]|nr:exodeoxyribonuclease VII small subunit [Acutalibacteraceae bacterium]